MEEITINQPKKLVLGAGALDQLMADIDRTGVSKIFVLADPHIIAYITKKMADLAGAHIAVSPGAEPAFSDLENLLTLAREHQSELVVGIGGGSVLDLAKLVAALHKTKQPVNDFVGNGLVESRHTTLFCVPTTSGAGSESSPNAILIDDLDNSKKGIIDAALMPDAVYIDPELIVSLPPAITAYTGLDALTHCIEAYANKNAHPVVDTYALEGIRLISQNLGKAIADGNDLEARTNVALGAYYGGMCLGPVNTAAVHALAYPLGTTYKIAHGLSNALLLPFVLEFNLNMAPNRYAEIAIAMGGERLTSDMETALQGIALIRQFIKDCGMPARLSELDIDESSIPKMAEDALLIQRLLKNNLREVSFEDAVGIYKSAL